MKERKDQSVWEYGDFQTPYSLAEDAICFFKNNIELSPKTIIEPSCGIGTFLIAAGKSFPHAECIIGVEINKSYIDKAHEDVSKHQFGSKVNLIHDSFFNVDWESVLCNVPKPILVIGNPPWVTNSDIGIFGGKNLPEKNNFNKNIGLDALTGKSNFDISEWMIAQSLKWVNKFNGTLAMLCKTAVARKILIGQWKDGQTSTENFMAQIDAKKHFEASVDACLFIANKKSGIESKDCSYFCDIYSDKPVNTFGYHEGMMISNVDVFYKHREIWGNEKNYSWRSGIKHDCSKVMELTPSSEGLTNGLGESVQLEEKLLYPFLKSSDIANDRTLLARKLVLATQRKIGEDTTWIQHYLPNTWNYLSQNSSFLDSRKSSIYRGKPKFSIFGVGSYSFSEYKVAISGFYKRLEFKVVGPIDGKPVLFDDTVYFISCKSKDEAEFIASLLNSKTSKEFISSIIFWTDKRPVTINLLKRINIKALAKACGKEEEYNFFNSGSPQSSDLLTFLEESSE